MCGEFSVDIYIVIKMLKKNSIYNKMVSLFTFILILLINILKIMIF